MKKLKLILLSREGCCLCEGLEERLRRISLENLKPPIELQVIDIDQGMISDRLRAQYSLEVPVMMVKCKSNDNFAVLPRVSPRLAGEGLSKWLQELCATLQVN